MARSQQVAPHSFARVPGPEIPRSTLKRNHTHKTTFDGGELIPIYIEEVLPGDTWKLKMNLFARLSTPWFPVMDNIHIETQFFFAANRYLWDNWVKMQGEQDNPGDTVDYTVPVLLNRAGGYTAADDPAVDYAGIPLGVEYLDGTGNGEPDHRPNALPFRAMRLIWNEWYRDQDLQDSLTVHKDNGPDALATSTPILKRGKRHDYFTAARPWPQKGDAVELPLGTTAPVISAGDGNPVVTASGFGTGVLSVNASGIVGHNVSGTSGQALLWSDPKLQADLSSATAATINQIREAFQIQRLYERDARSGSRYVEALRGRWGVISPDFRMQRPEYLGGGHTMLQTQSVANTTGGPGSGQGELAAYGIAAGKAGFVYSAVEHGWIIGFTSARADLTYQQGLHRMWTRRTRFDHYEPGLAHLGEQAISTVELYAQGNSGDHEVFGYVGRWDEYRVRQSMVTGLFRSSAAGDNDRWHLAQNFTSQPLLDATFIEDNPPIDRIIATPSEPHFIADFAFDVNVARAMPVYSVPGLIDHF